MIAHPKPKRLPNKGSKRRAMLGKAPGDSTLQDLWRKVVRAEWDNRCAFHDRNNCVGDLQCHHVIRRARPHLKHVPSNGILLCEAHHREAETLHGRMDVLYAVGFETAEWLSMMERKLFKDYLAEIGKTRAEYLNEQKDYLKALLAKREGAA